MTPTADAKLALPTEIGGQSIMVNVTLPVSFDLITNAIVGAIEGGSGYWCHTFLPLPESNDIVADIRSKGGSIWYSETEFWTRGGGARVEFDPPTEKDDGFRFVGKTHLEAGLTKMAAIAPQHFADLINENDDATTHDVFLQCVLFGEIIFG